MNSTNKSNLNSDSKHSQTLFKPNGFDPFAKQKICKYYLSGKCKIKNCAFLHSDEPEDRICRYYQTDFCIRGENCHFRHEKEQFPPEMIENKEKTVQNEKIAKNSPNFENLKGPPFNTFSLSSFSPSSPSNYSPLSSSLKELKIESPPPSVKKNINSLTPPPLIARKQLLKTPPDLKLGFSRPFSQDDFSLFPISKNNEIYQKFLRSQNQNVFKTPEAIRRASPYQHLAVQPAIELPKELTENHPQRKTFLKLLIPEHNDSTTSTMNFRGSNSSRQKPAKYNVRGNTYVNTFPLDKNPARLNLKLESRSLDESLSLNRGGEESEKTKIKAEETKGGGVEEKREDGKGNNQKGKKLTNVYDLDAAKRIELEDLKRKYFPHVSAKVIEDTFFSFSCDTRHTIVNLSKRYGVQSFESPAFPKKLQLNPSVTKAQKEKNKASKWVETGYQLNNMYIKRREKAIENALQRNKCLVRANQAYKMGARNLCNDYSTKAKVFDERMKEINEKASEAIFRERNEGLDGVIDLHGLHRDESIRFLERKLISCRKKKRKTVDVLCGTGHHSMRGKPVVLQSVSGYLEEKGLKYRVLPSGGRGGALRIYLD